MSYYELDQFIELIQKALAEIRSVKWGERLPRQVASPNGHITDSQNPRFWSNELVDKLQSERLGIRPAQNEEGD